MVVLASRDISGEFDGKGAMRVTDDRYRGEQAKFELALRMIEQALLKGAL